jgi:plastocyanin
MRRLLIVMAGIAVLAVSCGDDDDIDGQGTATPSSSGEASSSAPVALEGEVNDEGTEEISGDEVVMELDDYYFGPTFLEAAPGATVHVELENESDDTHTFTIDALGLDQEVAPGESATVDVTLPDEGATRFYCRFHHDQGMQGAFFFNEGDTIATGSATDDETTAITGY